MRQDLLVDFFRKQEKQPECWRLQIFGVPVWPLVRMQIYFKWRSKRGFASAFRSGLQYDPAKLRSLQSELSHPSSNKRILLISREDGLTDLVDNKFYDRFMSSVYLLTHSLFDVSLVSVLPKKERFDDCLDLSGLLYSYAKNASLQINKADWEAIEKLLLGLPSEFRLDLGPDEVIEQLKYFLVGRAFWSAVFEAKRPDLVVTTCFYAPQIMGACAAAHSRGLRTVDLQHGRVGSCHPVMSHWDFRHAPDSVFSLFPSEFWCWEKQNAENIEKTWSGFSKNITVKVFGNPWQFMRLNKAITDESGKSVNDCPHKRIVMLALQPIEDSTPQFVVDGLNLFENFEVWVRPHPHQLGSIADVQSELIGMGLKNFLIRDRNDLYSELNHVDILITAFSTVASEAQSLGIPVILTHHNSPIAFEDAIDEKTIFYRDRADNFFELLTLLTETTRSRELKSERVTTLAQMISCF